MRLKKAIYIALGCIGVGLGALGAALPLLPTIPFLMLAAFCFGRSSQRLHNWFIGTALYKNNLESFVQGNGMLRKVKCRIILLVTVIMTVGFLLMYRVPVGRIILALIWVGHIVYFTFGVKTVPEEGRT